ncbi:MAG: LssY C-terminal domain-containing protein, partial [Acidobacteriaceae bacterium]|nr:LssY C-terminal domain-containing protein [Acidobacteriaceae bacterium]
LLLLGSADQVDEAFRRARWTGESKRSLLVGYRMYRCLVQRMGYSMAPMANLTLNGVHATRSYQKSLDTLAKRHHVRLWRQQNSNIWLAAATEDIGIIFRHMHMTHAIDPVIDNERAKVVNDLWFTGCVETASLLSRNLLMPVVEKGVPMVTDENIAVVRLQDCEGSNTLSPAASSLSRMRQAFAAVGIDVARANPATLALITFRTIADRKRRTYARHLEAQAWRRPSVVDKSRHDPERPDAGPVEASAHGQREPDSLQAKAATAE